MGAKIRPPTLKVIELLSQLSLTKLTQSSPKKKKNHEEKGHINFQEFFWSELRIKDPISNSKFQSKIFVSKFKIPHYKFQILNLKFHVPKLQV